MAAQTLRATLDRDVAAWAYGRGAAATGRSEAERGFAVDVPHTDPTGPVFVCYREDDGLPLARDVAGVLRSVGVPVWFAPDDMGAGRFDRTFKDAASRGLSGTVLVATENVAISNFIQRVEAPTWKPLLDDPDFVFAAVNTATTGDGTTDFRFPDRLVPQPGQPLADYKQYEPSDLDRLAAELAARRVRLLADHGPPHALSVEITTRDAPHAGPSDWQLRATISPPSDGATVLGPAQAEQVRRLTRELPRLATRAGTRTVRVRGGMHLPVAVAVGLSLPVTRDVRVFVHDAFGDEWDSAARDGTSNLEPLPHDVAPGRDGDGVAVLVDLVSRGKPTPAFDAFVAELDVPGYVINAPTRDRISPDDGEATALRAAELVAEAAGRHHSPVVHLCLRTPAAVAVLLGRHLNTYRLSLYDLEDATDPPRYVRFAAARANGPDGNVIMEEP